MQHLKSTTVICILFNIVSCIRLDSPKTTIDLNIFDIYMYKYDTISKRYYFKLNYNIINNYTDSIWVYAYKNTKMPVSSLDYYIVTKNNKVKRFHQYYEPFDPTYEVLPPKSIRNFTVEYWSDISPDLSKETFMSMDVSFRSNLQVDIDKTYIILSDTLIDSTLYQPIYMFLIENDNQIISLPQTFNIDSAIIKKYGYKYQ